MLILVDVNEESTNKAVVNRLRKKFGEESIFISQLIAGDINIPLPTGLLAIERKEINDLLGSIADGRVFAQAEAMANNARFSAFIVHGELKFTKDDKVVADGRTTEWNGKSIRNALKALQWSGSAVDLVDDEAGFIRSVEEMIMLCSKTEHMHSGKHTKRTVTFPPLDPAIEFMAGLPGIGIKRATALLEWVGGFDNKGGAQIGSVAQALDWLTMMPLISPDERPEGWGTKLLKTTREFLGLAGDEILHVDRISSIDKKQFAKSLEEIRS